MAATAAKLPSVEGEAEDVNLLSATVVAGLKNLGTIISPALTKTLIANSMKLTLHPDASEYKKV